MRKAFTDPDTNTAHDEAFDTYNFHMREFLSAVSHAVNELGLTTDEGIALQRAGLTLTDSALTLGRLATR
tara:strand:- start:85 stop:294 length:210 start_codon:yes stop_codon:yes gene_type:complete